MKKIVITCLSILGGLFLQAQSFQKGDIMLSPGFGLGVYGVGYGVGFAVPVVLNFDIGVHDYVSVGAYGGFWTRKWNYAFNENYRFSSTHVGARATFHFWQLIDDMVEGTDLRSDKFDVYFTPWLGYNLRSARWQDGGGVQTGNFGWGNRFQGGAQLGARYYLNDHIGFFGEWGGTPTAYSNFGMTFKF